MFNDCDKLNRIAHGMELNRETSAQRSKGTCRGVKNNRCNSHLPFLLRLSLPVRDQCNKFAKLLVTRNNRASERANPTSSAAAMNNSMHHHSLGSFESVGGVNGGGGKAIDPCRIH